MRSKSPGLRQLGRPAHLERRVVRDAGLRCVLPRRFDAGLVVVEAYELRVGEGACEHARSPVRGRSRRPPSSRPRQQLLRADRRDPVLQQEVHVARTEESLGADEGVIRVLGVGHPAAIAECLHDAGDHLVVVGQHLREAADERRTVVVGEHHRLRRRQRRTCVRPGRSRGTRMMPSPRSIRAGSAPAGPSSSASWSTVTGPAAASVLKMPSWSPM